MSSARTDEFAARCQALRQNQITEAVVDPLTTDQLYELTRIALDNDCYTVFQQPRIYARKLAPVDAADFPGFAYAVPTYGTGTFFDTTFLASPVMKDGRNELYTAHDQPSPRNVLEMAIEKSSKEWVIFTHHDVYIPKNWGARFWRAIQDAERRFGPIGVAGVFGVSGDRRVQRTESGLVIDQQGTRTLVGSTPLPAQVRILDGCVLAIRRTSGILPDPELGWHFYDADMCLKSEELGLKNVALESWLLHRSTWREADPRFKASEEIFKRKWARALPVEVPCALVA